MGRQAAQMRGQLTLSEDAERFENLNAKFQKNSIIGKKNEVLRFLLQLAGSGAEDGDHKSAGSNATKDNITKALMSSMLQSNQFASFEGG